MSGKEISVDQRRFHVRIYRLDGERWTFDHVLNGTETPSLGEASCCANGYNSGTVEKDPRWMWLAVAEEVGHE